MGICLVHTGSSVNKMEDDMSKEDSDKSAVLACTTLAVECEGRDKDVKGGRQQWLI
jgi:hypothetical protein